jgi:hypothetical protein
MALICIGLAGFGFFGFASYPMALEMAAEQTYPIDASMSESWVHVNVQVSRRPFLTSPLGSNFDTRGEFVP